MIIFKRLPENGTTPYNLYILENQQEFETYQKETNVKLSTLETCEKGDYVLTDNGYYVPVTYVTNRPFGSTDRKGNQRYVETCNMAFSFKMYPDGNRNRKYLDYDPHKRQMFLNDTRRRMVPTASVYAIIKLMDAGMNLVDAFKLTHQKYIQGKGSTNKFYRAVSAFLNNRNNIKMLLEYGQGGKIMAKKNLKLDAASTVKMLNNIMHGKDEGGKEYPVQMRLKAMDYYMKNFAEKEVLEPKNEIFEEEQKEYNEIMSNMVKVEN